MKAHYKIMIGITVLAIIPIIVYVLHFWGCSLSMDTSDWGSFGSYFGGLLSPILTTLTILILIMQHFYDRKENLNIKKEKIINDYIRYLDRLEEKLIEIEKIVKKYLPPQNNRIEAIENPRNHGSHPIIWDFVDTWNIYKKFENKILLIDPEHPVKEYIIKRFGKTVILLESLGYIKI